MLKWILVAISLTLSTPAFSKAIFNIVPASISPIGLTARGNAILSYTVINNSNSPINNITIQPGYLVTDTSFTLSTENNTCNGISLAPSASCTFNISIQSTQPSANTLLIPRVCGYSGIVCSVPIESNRVSVHTLTSVTYSAYIANAGSNTISICPVNNDGSFGICTTSNGNGTFVRPQGVVINPAGTFAYIANGANTISICPINNDGSFGTCIASTASGTLSQPTGVALATLTAGSFLYASNYPTHLLSICPINNDGSLGVCTTTTGNGTFDFVQAVAVNPANTFAYIANGDTVSICPINNDGSLGFCTTSTGNGTFSTEGISFNSSGTFAYMGNVSNIASIPSTVSICPINNDGSLGFCTTSTGNGTFVSNFSFQDGLYMLSLNNFGYIPNNNNNTVSICPMSKDGSSISTPMNPCTTSTGNGTFNVPNGIALTSLFSSSRT